jgi:hypothetical protein
LKGNKKGGMNPPFSPKEYFFISVEQPVEAGLAGRALAAVRFAPEQIPASRG